MKLTQDLKMILKKALGIKKIDELYSKIPIDITLEQTVNADAARRLT